MKKKTSCKSAFTLIELLVVVLIIGILASIALPQYQKAVEKSKATQALTLLKSVDTAYTAYYLANGTYPTQFDELAVEIPWPVTQWGSSVVTDSRGNGEWEIGLDNGSRDRGIVVRRKSGNYSYGKFFIWHYYDYMNLPLDTLLCAEYLSASSPDRGKYCKQLFGAKYLAISNTTGGHLYYQMP